jgi:AraC-like DNA-binding protein
MPEEQSSRQLVASPLVRVYDVVCRAPRAGYGPAMSNAITQIGFPRRGLFLIERRGEPLVVDTNTALVLRPDDEYRIGHPTNEGDEGVVLALPEQVADDAFEGGDQRVGHLAPRDRLAVSLLTRMLRDDETIQLEAEEATVLLLASLSQRVFANPTGMNARPLNRAQRRRIEQARVLLAASPTTAWDLRGLGLAVGCSPFQLARQFRAATGETISRYVLNLRLAIAVERLADGERNLAALAFDLGFAHHSHFSARFRRTFGMTPKEARAALTRRRLDSLRSFSRGGRLN